MGRRRSIMDYRAVFFGFDWVGGVIWDDGVCVGVFTEDLKGKFGSCVGDLGS